MRIAPSWWEPRRLAQSVEPGSGAGPAALPDQARDGARYLPYPGHSAAAGSLGMGAPSMTTSTPGIVLDALLASLQKAADFNHDDVVPPAAILWPDEKREWERLVPRLRLVVP